MTQSACKAIEFGEKQTKNKGYYAVEVIRGRYQSKARMRLFISAVTDILSLTVSELSQLIVQILDTLHFRATLWGRRDNVRCPSWAHWKARSGLAISVN